MLVGDTVYWRPRTNSSVGNDTAVFGDEYNNNTASSIIYVYIIEVWYTCTVVYAQPYPLLLLVIDPPPVHTLHISAREGGPEGWLHKGRKEGGDVLAAKDELLSEMTPRCESQTGKLVQDPHFG